SPVKRATAQGLGDTRYVMYLPTAESEGASTRGATSAVARRRQLGVSMKSLPQWSATVLLTAPVGAWALGLGDIELQSALNQPLRAEIELLSVTPEDLDGLRVTLASRATFERYELDLTPNLSGLDFNVGRNAAGRYVVTVTSRQPMADPFLTMLVEATWPRGRLLREYTVLLDPPIF